MLSWRATWWVLNMEMASRFGLGCGWKRPDRGCASVYWRPSVTKPREESRPTEASRPEAGADEGAVVERGDRLTRGVGVVGMAHGRIDDAVHRDVGLGSGQRGQPQCDGHGGCAEGVISNGHVSPLCFE